jgi:replicative DNA helicase
MKQILDIHSGQKIAGGISTSLKGLDEITAGIKPGEYIVIAGRTGQGKSSLARQIVLNAAKSGNRPLFCTIEMTKENLVQCMAATESRVPFDLILDPRYMTREQLEKVAESVKQIQELPSTLTTQAGWRFPNFVREFVRGLSAELTSW